MRTYASKPTQIALLLTLTLPVALLTPSARADELVMPYSCQMVGGRPLLVASSPQTYRISGPHDQRKITLCSPADPGRCRAWNIHSFNVNCGGAEVSWPAMIAGSPPARDGRARLENGRFQLSMPPAWNLPASDPCARNMDAPPAQRDQQLERYCDGRSDLTQPSSVEMPAGFAPTLGLDIKFNAGNSPVASASSHNAAAPSSGSLRPEPGLTAPSPGGGLTWKASPVAPPQPGALQAGVPFDPDQPPLAPKKKQPPETKAAARAEPSLKPALPPNEQPPPIRQPPLTAARPRTCACAPPAIERAVPQAIAPPVATPPVPLPAAPPAAAPFAVTPPVIKPVEPPAKVASPPQSEPAPLPAPAPIAASPAPHASPTPPPQTATSEPAKSTQVTEHKVAEHKVAENKVAENKVAENTAKQEPYSSRPQKLTPPDTGPSLTTILIAASLAITALGTFLWMRRRREEDDVPVRPRVFAGPGFDPAYDDHTRTIPNLSGPMASDGLHRSAGPYPADPSFGPYAQHAAKEAFDDPLGPVLPEWTGSDQPHLEPAHFEPELAHDWTAPDHTAAHTPNHALRHTLEIPARDDPGQFAAPGPDLETANTNQLAPTLPEPPLASHSAGAADWPEEMPHTRDDALHILGMGVTSKASLPAMKKIVDGLRFSWHPGQATDDADRAIRELRIRQINTAWDILTASHTTQESNAGQLPPHLDAVI